MSPTAARARSTCGCAGRGNFFAGFWRLLLISKVRYKRLCLWRVEILNETVAAEIAALPTAMQARFIRIAERIASVGLERLTAPHVKHLEGRLWELRLTGRDGVARALYVTAIGRRVVVVRAFVKKTQKTSRAEIELALQRAKDIT
jgi:phage-related protein